MLLLDDGVPGGLDRRDGCRPPRHSPTRCWPGGLTVVVPQRPDVPLPAALTGGTPTIGLRVPDHDAPRALAAAVGPLPTTSANVSGLPEARDAHEILAQLGDGVDLILDGGPARGGPPSTVVDCTGERPLVLRDGAIPVARLAAILDAAGIAHDLVGGLALSRSGRARRRPTCRPLARPVPRRTCPRG